MTERRAWLVSSNRWNSAITEYAISWARAMQLLGWKVTFSPLKNSPAERRAQALDIPCQPITFSWREIALGRPHGFKKWGQSGGPNFPATLQVAVAFGGPESRFVSALPSSVRKIRFRGNAIEASLPEKLRQSVGLRDFELVVTPSELLTKTMQQILPSKEVKTVVLGVDTEVFRFNAPSFNNSRRDIVIFGRLDPVKGHNEFLDLYAAALRQNSELANLHIVGEAANVSENDLLSAIAKRSLGDKVRLTTRRIAEVHQLLSGALLGVVSSLGSEIICRVAQEFLLCGCPVLVTDVGSLPETVFPGAGSCYNPRDPDPTVLLKAVATASAETLEQRHARAAAARRCFSLEAMSESLGKILI